MAIPGLGALFGRGAASAGVSQVDDLLGQLMKYQKPGEGFSPEQLVKLAPLLAVPTAAAATAAAPSGGGLLATLGGALTSEFIGSRLFGGAPPAYAQASAEPAGRGFLTTTQEQLAVQQYVATENFRRQALNAARQTAGLDPLPLLDAQEFIAGASAVKERELGGATQRKIQEIEAQRGFDVAIAEIARQAEVEKQRLASQAAVAAQREQSLGDIQRQRVESSYATASNLLNQAIKDVVARERYENNATLSELAKAI